MEPLIELRGILKVFRSPLLQRPKLALEGLDLTVAPGEIFGFLGPNGAGKTTTIKILLGLIRPTAGGGTVLGRPFGSVSARHRLGFLPDAPNFYRYLTARELLRLAGELHRLKRSTLDAEIEGALDRVALEEEARGRALRTYSRGMLQRVGLALAILHRPALVVLDEPMSGLDPAGRSEFRSLIRTLRDEGTTVFLSSHVLADIEATADRVAILDRGRLVQSGPLRECLVGERRVIEIAFDAPAESLPERVRSGAHRLRPGPSGWIADVEENEADRTVRAILEAGGHLLHYAPRRISLEDFFLEHVAGRAGRRELPPPPRRESAVEAASRDAAPRIDSPERATGPGTPARRARARGE